MTIMDELFVGDEFEERYFLVHLEITHKHTREQRVEKRKIGTITGEPPTITQMLGMVEKSSDIGAVSLIGWEEIATKEEYYEQ